MDKEFLKWLEAERDEALSISVEVLTEDRKIFWQEHYTMLSSAVDEIQSTMYKEATGS